jgi:hypothetical protein
MSLGVTVAMVMIKEGEGIMERIGGVVAMIMVGVMTTNMKPHPLIMGDNMATIQIVMNMISGIDLEREINGSEIPGKGIRRPGRGVMPPVHPIHRVRTIRRSRGVLTHKAE